MCVPNSRRVPWLMQVEERASCSMMTPFGVPVVPEVKRQYAAVRGLARPESVVVESTGKGRESKNSCVTSMTEPTMLVVVSDIFVTV